MKCPYCKVQMNTKTGLFGPEKIEFEEFQCPKCGEELLSILQLKNLGKKHKEWRDSHRAKFSKWGNSIALRIPKTIVMALHIKSGATASVKAEKNGILIVPA